MSLHLICPPPPCGLDMIIKISLLSPCYSLYFVWYFFRELSVALRFSYPYTPYVIRLIISYSFDLPTSSCFRIVRRIMILGWSFANCFKKISISSENENSDWTMNCFCKQSFHLDRWFKTWTRFSRKFTRFAMWIVSRMLHAAFAFSAHELRGPSIKSNLNAFLLVCWDHFVCIYYLLYTSFQSRWIAAGWQDISPLFISISKNNC